MTLFLLRLSTAADAACRSRVIFTCRKAWVGGLGCLPPATVEMHKVEPLPKGASESILQATARLQLQLDRQQLSAVLAYCGGLPLALTVIGGFMADDGTKAGVLQDIERSLKTKKAVGVGDMQDEIVATMRRTVDLLDQKLRSIWLDIAMLFSDGSIPWRKLEMTYGQHQLNNLLLRNLISKVTKDDIFSSTDVPQVHHVLLTVANDICQPGISEYRDFNSSQVPDPLPADTQVSCGSVLSFLLDDQVYNNSWVFVSAAI